MEVYILVENIYHEDTQIISVHFDKDHADKLCADLEQKNISPKLYGHQVEKWEIENTGATASIRDYITKVEKQNAEFREMLERIRLNSLKSTPEANRQMREFITTELMRIDNEKT